MKRNLLLVLILIVTHVSAQTPIGPSPYTVPSSGLYSTPPGVTSLDIECWGGGGGGGGARAIYNTTAAGAAGGGGGGGAYSKTTIAVISTQNITIGIGASGTGGTNIGGNGGTGGTSYVYSNSSTVASADGGSGGVGKSNTDIYAYGTGGSGSFSGLGTVNRGGNGATGAANSKGGGGGGGGGSTAIGGNGSGVTSGTGGATGGGNGGAGANNNNSAGVAGSPGSVAGGGGGGGAAWTYGTSGQHIAVGGSGAPGQVIITYSLCTPPSGGTISGPDTVCGGAVSVAYTVTGIIGTVSAVSWTVPAGALIISGQGSSTILVNFGSATSGNITCAATYITCTGPTLTFPVFVSTPPAAPSITQNTDTLSVPPVYVTYQWFYEGSALPNDTNNFIKATISGHYSVFVTDSNGCGLMTAEFNYIDVGVRGNSTLSHGFSIFPNPAHGFVNLYFDNSITNGQLQIVNLLGEKVYSRSITKNSLSLKLDAGVYFVQMTNGETTVAKRLIVE